MGVFSFLFGKKPKAEKSESGNKAYDYLKDSYGGMVGGGTDAYGLTNSLLGVGGADSGPGSEAYQNYLDSTGYNFIKDEALDGVMSQFAGRGALRSGAAGKAFQDRAANIGKTYFDNYLGHLEKQSQLGLGAGGLIGGAGQWSKGTGGTAGTSGAFGDLVKLGAAIFGSDRRLKTDINKVDELSDGLGIYDFRYHWDAPGTVRTGVMADEVSKLRPWALGPVVGGYATVDYGRLAA